MFYKILADLMVALHFAWILFMLGGVVHAIWGIRNRHLRDWFWFRTIHLLGIVFVAVTGFAGIPCPLTTWEVRLRALQDPATTYPGSFIVHWLERLIYPHVSIWVVLIPTALLALTAIAIYILIPPQRARGWLRRMRS